MYDRTLLPLDGSELAEGVEPHAMAMDPDFFAGLSERRGKPFGIGLRACRARRTCYPPAPPAPL